MSQRVKKIGIGVIEWQTVALAFFIYSLWVAGLFLYKHEWTIPAFFTLVFASAWQMSLQHEVLHGHPTRNHKINLLFAIAPLGVWYPYIAYRDSHLAHHHNQNITMPGLDPESYFVTEEQWLSMGRMEKALRTFNMTFIGRMVIGPMMIIWLLYKAEMRDILRGNVHKFKAWSAHFLLLVALLFVVYYFFGVPPWLYLALGYVCLAVAMIRSFYEHRTTAEHFNGRSVINEAGAFWRLLFLNNNYHYVHHENPHIPWYDLPKVYFRNKAHYLQKNENFLVKGYGVWMLKYAVRAVEKPYISKVG